MTRVCVQCLNRQDIKNFQLNGKYHKSYCTPCWNEYQRNYRRLHPEKDRQYGDNERFALLAKVDVILGLCCRKCGFEDGRALVIDHVNDDGAAERKRIGKGREALYRAILKNPARYQRLCSNCNTIKEYMRVHDARIKKYQGLT